MVELRFRQALLEPETAEDMCGNVHLYKASVEFIGLDDWRDELQGLLELCSAETNGEGAPPKIGVKPEPRTDAAAAWAKINEV